jgi:hypothetical protein
MNKLELKFRQRKRIVIRRFSYGIVEHVFLRSDHAGFIANGDIIEVLDFQYQGTVRI